MTLSFAKLVGLLTNHRFETPRRLTFIPFALQMVIGHYGGDKEIRTLDPLRARQVLSQLSYIPIFYVIFNLRFFRYLNILISTIFSFPWMGNNVSFPCPFVIELCS